MQTQTVELGDHVRDNVTNLEWIVTSKTKYLNGCHRVGVQPRELKDGRPVDAYHMDIEQCEVVTKAVVAVMQPTGGPMPDPVR